MFDQFVLSTLLREVQKLTFNSTLELFQGKSMSISLYVLIDTDRKTTNEWLVWPIEIPPPTCVLGTWEP